MSNFICLSILVLICIIGVLCGSGGLLMGVQEKDDIYHKDTANGTIITGVVILVISLVGFGFLGEPFTDALNDAMNEKLKVVPNTKPYIRTRLKVLLVATKKRVITFVKPKVETKW